MSILSGGIKVVRRRLRSHGPRLFGAIPITLTLLAAPVFASEAAAQEESTQAEGEEEPRSLIGVFVGGTSGDEGGFTLGLEYELELFGPLAAGILVERVFADEATTLLAPFAVLESGLIDWQIGLGWKWFEDESDGFLRLGARTNFGLPGEWVLSPEAGLNIGGGTEFVYGVVLGLRF